MAVTSWSLLVCRRRSSCGGIPPHPFPPHGAGTLDPPAAVMTGDEPARPPRFGVLELGRERRRVPYRLAAGFPAAAVASCPLVVALTDSWHGDTVLEVHTRLDDADEGRVFLDGLLRRGRTENPFRGKVLEAAYRNGFGLTFRVLELAPVDRGDVVLPAPVWAEVDRTVHGLFAAHGHLAAAGLPANRACSSPARRGRARRSCAAPSPPRWARTSPSCSATPRR